LGGDLSRGELSQMVSVFISHSHQDIELVKRLINLLRSALNLQSKEIRATSVDGFRLPGGSNTAEQLRTEVQGAKVLIGVISNSSLKSAYVIFELGARWGSGKPMVPLLASGTSPNSLEGPLQGINVLSCRSSAQLHQFVEEMASHLNLSLDRPAAYQEYLDQVVEIGDELESGPVTQSYDSVDASAIQSISSLSEAAKEILMGASCDENGVVMRFRTASGLHIKTNGADFVPDRDPRAEAHWQGALGDLVKGGFLEDRTGKGEVFGVTDFGYKKVDSLGEEPSNPLADLEANLVIGLTENHLSVISALARADHAAEYYTSVAAILHWNRVKTQHFIDDLVSGGYLEVLALQHGPGYGLSRKGRALAVESGFTEGDRW
jgi:hypothetical protein